MSHNDTSQKHRDNDDIDDMTTMTKTTIKHFTTQAVDINAFNLQSNTHAFTRNYLASSKINLAARFCSIKIATTTIHLLLICKVKQLTYLTIYLFNGIQPTL